jgi:predicted AlkP superfamily pyrophosphatase or phosphodiesterase
MRHLLFILFVLLTASACQRSLSSAAKPAAEPQYLILISMDGFRWDYLDRFQPPHLSRFVKEGVRAESMISCFPSKTFTNHYSIATGMYPDHHGMVDNSFFDAEKNLVYGMGRRELVQDGSWYGGTPIWVWAAQKGLKTASFFFVGSEADIQGVRPHYYYNYDGSIPNEKRVQQALDWLRLSEAERPRLITMYFSDMDDQGHRYGPNADEKLREKLMALDSVLGRLFEGLDSLQLPVNVIFVSDHGMAEVPVKNLLPIESIENEDQYMTVNNGALAHLYLRDTATAEAVYQNLKADEKHYKIYRTEETPYFETPPTNPRWGNFIVVPDSGYYFVNARTMGFRQRSGDVVVGEHGFDPERREMHGIFFARGPAIREAWVARSFKNIHVYPLMCRILGIGIPTDIDGKAEVLNPVLRR